MTIKTTAALVHELARNAGKIMVRVFGMGIKKEWKRDSSPVTAADKEINQMVSEWVQKNFPKHGFLGEEGDMFNEKASDLWICDPIDGTIPFSHGIPTCTFSLALVQDGRPTLGVLYDPFLKRLFFAEKNRGATCNGKSVCVSSARSLRQTAIGTTIWKNAAYDIRSFNDQLAERGAFVLCHACTTYPGMLVAAGELSANIWPGKNPWDVAAQKIIVEEAGGKATDLFGKEQRYDRRVNGWIVSNGHVHSELVDIAKTYIKQKSA
ncbi:MAG: inositol monophosphatase [Patescibacteria group bacterium]